jgi:hypothetical protein
MEEKLRELLQDSFGEAAARDANVAIAQARRGPAARAAAADDAPGLRLYEIILTGFDAFASDLLPKLVYHLESIGARLPDCRGVLIAAFVGERLHFVEAKAFIARACGILHVTPEELVRRHGTGERRTAVCSDPLLLPGPKGDA